MDPTIAENLINEGLSIYFEVPMGPLSLKPQVRNLTINDLQTSSLCSWGDTTGI